MVGQQAQRGSKECNSIARTEKERGCYDNDEDEDGKMMIIMMMRMMIIMMMRMIKMIMMRMRMVIMMMMIIIIMIMMMIMMMI